MTMPLDRQRGVSMIDVLDRVLDKGIVIDYWARISLLGVDILTAIDARVVVASIETYLQYSEPIGRTGSLARGLPGADINFARPR
jgi:gas vesicle structural protein